MPEAWVASAEGKVEVRLKGGCGQGQEEAPSWKGVGPQDPTLSERPPAFGCAKPTKRAAILLSDLYADIEEGANSGSMRSWERAFEVEGTTWAKILRCRRT